ncbi:MAG TPA: UDP-N-acetylmuramoyl-L-alanine--D-glutamate ligase, partial [Blastocatellia bacterium]|nr:UDP-N-acetylmuramoyl-L-alanine--D-glutamate ligase [Blastocatellia bacterium]
GDNIQHQLDGLAPIVRANGISDAVEKGYELARMGDAVLLAPACASFDMFRSYEERGTVFKAEVAKLSEKQSGQVA